MLENPPVEVVGLRPAQLFQHVLGALLRRGLAFGEPRRDRRGGRPRHGQRGFESDACFGATWDRRSISASSCEWRSSSRSTKTDSTSVLIPWAVARASGPFRGFENHLFQILARLAGATAGSSSQSFKLLMRTSGYVCPLNGSRSTNALGRRSRLCSAMAFRNRLVLPEPLRPKIRCGRRLTAARSVPLAGSMNRWTASSLARTASVREFWRLWISSESRSISCTAEERYRWVRLALPFRADMPNRTRPSAPLPCNEASRPGVPSRQSGTEVDRETERASRRSATDLGSATNSARL